MFKCYHFVNKAHKTQTAAYIGNIIINEKKQQNKNKRIRIIRSCFYGYLVKLDEFKLSEMK